MSTRSQVAAQLAAILPATLRVIDHPREIDTPGDDLTGVVIVHRRSIAKHPHAGPGNYLETFAIWLIEPLVDEQLAEDSLDANLQLVIDALDGVSWGDWQTAERTTFIDTYPAYRVDLTLSTKNTPSSEDPAP